MAQVMGLKYESIVAKPDGHGFFSCIVKQNTDKDAVAVRNLTALKLLQSKWEHAANAFERNNDHRVLQTHRQDSESDMAGVDSVRMCARNQVLEVDAKRMAEKVLEYALNSCGARV
jgi:RNase P protein component